MLTNLNVKRTRPKIETPKLKVLVVSRKDYQGRSIKRKLDNEKQFLSFLQSELLNDAYVESVDFSTMPMVEQIKTWIGYDVAIASHGAAQVYSTYSPPWFSMIEIQQPERYVYYLTVCGKR